MGLGEPPIGDDELGVEGGRTLEREAGGGHDARRNRRVGTWQQDVHLLQRSDEAVDVKVGKDVVGAVELDLHLDGLRRSLAGCVCWC
jgi:hypothetical protein